MNFTDSIDENVEVLTELLRGISPGDRNFARLAANRIENTWHALIKDNPRNAVVALGAAWAVMKMAQHIVHQQRDAAEKGGNLIQLLS
jgi:hypothetical protein